MALEDFKRTQDLKAEQERLSVEYNTRYSADRERILEEVSKEFISFLSAEGFSTNRQGNILTATYSGASLSLAVPQAKDNFFGALSVLKFKDSRYPKEQWSIVLLEGKDRPSIGRVVVSSVSNDENERLTKQINELKYKLEAYKPLEYSVMYYQDSDSSRNAGAKEGPIVSSIKETISAIMQRKA